MTKSIARWKTRINEIFPQSRNAPLETVVLDTKKEIPLRFKDNADKLWKLISGTRSFECKDITAVKTELDQVKEENERLKRLISIQVSNF